MKEPRLHFTDQERADPALKKPIRKAEKAAQKADAAQDNIPKKKVKRTEVDPKTGKVTTKLVLEDKKKPPSKLVAAARDVPGQMAAAKLHRNAQEDEQDNVGVESAHRAAQTLESTVRLVREGNRSHKLKPYRKAAAAEYRLEKANLSALYRKAQCGQPQAFGNPVTRWQQKRAVRKRYAAAKRAGNSGGKVAGAAGKRAKSNAFHKLGAVVFRNKKGAAIVLLVLVCLCMLLNTLSSCSMLAQGVSAVVSGSTFPSEDADMLGAEAAYAAKEAGLQAYLDSYESTHDYDEYHFELDEIGHDPYVLISLLTAYYGGPWTLEQVQDTLDLLFSQQYTLTERVVTQTGQDGVPYTICYITLKNQDLSHLPVYLLSEEQMALYAAYIAVQGNRPDLFPGGGTSGGGDFTYEVPPEALADRQFATMLAEAEKYLGWPYVWGGSSPSTSFDCSGYISWVINHSGWNVGRLTANGLLGICTPISAANARPGDLIFFQKTYNTSGASHVGLYVGNNKMIHCGDPISYANINTNYWQSHFLTFGRLP